jgi:hemerythrin superfamily protein
MSDFIYELKQEHSQIRVSLQEISSMDLHSKEARKKLLEMKALFINHIKKEDEEIYPKLKEVSSNDAQFMNILNYLESEIRLISQFVSIFFDRVPDKKASQGLNREFSLISSTLIKRIDHEEEIFFPEYEKISRS